MAVAAATNAQTAHPAIPISFHSPAPSSGGSSVKVLVMSFHVGSAVVNDQTALLAKSAGVTTTTSSATMAAVTRGTSPNERLPLRSRDPTPATRTTSWVTIPRRMGLGVSRAQRALIADGAAASRLALD